MAKLTIVYHSTPNVEEMVSALAEGAYSVNGADVVTKKVKEATIDDILNCDAVAFGSPTDQKDMSQELKGFFTRISGIKGKVDGKPCLAFANSRLGEKDAVINIESACAELGLKKIADGTVSILEPTPEYLTGVWELGKKLLQAAK